MFKSIATSRVTQTFGGDLAVDALISIEYRQITDLLKVEKPPVAVPRAVLSVHPIIVLSGGRGDDSPCLDRAGVSFGHEKNLIRLFQVLVDQGRPTHGYL